MRQTHPELETLYYWRSSYERTLSELNALIDLKKSQKGNGDLPTDLETKKIYIESELRDLNDKIKTIEETDEAEESFILKSEKIEHSINSLVDEETDEETIATLKKEIDGLKEIYNNSIDNLKNNYLSSTLGPQLTVLLPKVKYIDASLAYRYADLQSDVNIMIGFTTLFLGTGIASGVSLIISLTTETQASVRVAHLVFTILSLIVAAIFGTLSVKYKKKANEAIREIESEAGERKLSD